MQQKTRIFGHLNDPRIPAISECTSYFSTSAAVNEVEMISPARFYHPRSVDPLTRKGLPMDVIVSSAEITAGEKEREIEHKAKMQVVAKLITSSNTPPSWFIDLLSNWSFEVAWAHSVETMLPTRLELHDTLEAIETFATRLSELLQSSITQGFLASGVEKARPTSRMDCPFSPC
jgi:hypothetical protein